MELRVGVRNLQEQSGPLEYIQMHSRGRNQTISPQRGAKGAKKTDWFCAVLRLFAAKMPWGFCGEIVANMHDPDRSRQLFVDEHLIAFRRRPFVSDVTFAGPTQSSDPLPRRESPRRRRPLRAVSAAPRADFGSTGAVIALTAATAPEGLG